MTKPSILVTRLRVAPDEAARETDAVAAADAAVVDVALDAAAALDLCRDLGRLRPDLPVAALVCCGRSLPPWTLRSLLGANVKGVLDLEARPEEVLAVLRRLARGETVLHVHLVDGYAGALRDVLSARQERADAGVRLLELVACGLSDQEIARRVHLSPHTVKHRIERLRGELRVRNRTELADWAGRGGFYRPHAAA